LNWKKVLINALNVERKLKLKQYIFIKEKLYGDAQTAECHTLNVIGMKAAPLNLNLSKHEEA